MKRSEYEYRVWNGTLTQERTGATAKVGTRTSKITTMPEQITIDAKIDWYDGYFLDYDGEQFFDAVHALKLNVGDKIKVIISKAE